MESLETCQYRQKSMPIFLSIAADQLAKLLGNAHLTPKRENGRRKVVKSPVNNNH